MKEKIILLFKQKKVIFLFVAVLLIPLIFLVFSQTDKNGEIKPSPIQALPTVTPIIPFGKEIEVVSIYPKDGERDVDQNAVIRITFADSLPQNIIIHLEPEVRGKYVRNESQHTIDFIPSRAFGARTQYTAKISIENRSFLTPDKESTGEYQWTFLIGEQHGESGMSEEELRQMIEMRQQTDNEYQARKQRLPFITSLPYQTPRFKVEIAATSDTVTITTFGTHRDYHTAYRQEALEWIRSKGGNPDTITIRYNPATL